MEALSACCHFFPSNTQNGVWKTFIHVAYLNSLCLEFQEWLLFFWVGSIIFHDPQKLYFSISFRLRKSLAKWPQPLDLSVGVTHLYCFSFLPWGCSIVLPFNQKLIFFVCRWCRIPSFYTVAGLYLMYLVQRQLSFTAFRENSMKAPCD